MNLDKKPLQSKKFLSFILALVILAGILVTALLTQTFGWAMVTFMVVGITGLCSLAIGYVLSQASLDKFLNSVTNIMTKKGKE